MLILHWKPVPFHAHLALDNSLLTPLTALCYAARLMKIDVFNHFFPQRYFTQYIDTGGIQDIGKRVRNIQAIHDLDFRFRVADEFGEGYTQFLTLPAPPAFGRGRWLRRIDAIQFPRASMDCRSSNEIALSRVHLSV